MLCSACCSAPADCLDHASLHNAPPDAASVDAQRDARLRSSDDDAGSDLPAADPLHSLSTLRHRRAPLAPHIATTLPISLPATMCRNSSAARQDHAIASLPLSPLAV
jgi:hypothetical protein